MNVYDLARKCAQVQEDGTAQWAGRVLGLAEAVRLMHLLAGEVLGPDGLGSPNKWLPWTPEEDEVLLLGYESCDTVEDIAIGLGRTRGAVCNRLHNLRKRGTKVTRPHHVFGGDES